MSGTAAHIVRLYVSVPPIQPPSRNRRAKNSSRIAARLAANSSGKPFIGSEPIPTSADQIRSTKVSDFGFCLSTLRLSPQEKQGQIILELRVAAEMLGRGPGPLGTVGQRQLGRE